MTQDELTVEVASDKHLIYVDEILKTIEEAAKVRGTGIAKRKVYLTGIAAKAFSPFSRFPVTSESTTIHSC